MDARQPDPDYSQEAVAATAQGLPVGLISYEALVYDQVPAKAVRRVLESSGSPQTAIYQGWMLLPESYARLYATLETRQIRLINLPAAYRYCHYLPEWYPALSAYTPRSVWLDTNPTWDLEGIMARLQPALQGPADPERLGQIAQT